MKNSKNLQKYIFLSDATHNSIGTDIQEKHLYFISN